MIYLDNAATSMLKPPEVEQAVVNALRNSGNAGRGVHAPTLTASRIVFDTRVKLSNLFGIADPSRISFTSNATEALNLALKGSLNTGDHVITTVCEHNSVLRPLYLLEQEGTQVSFLQAHQETGCLCLDGLESFVQSNTKAVVVTHASNVTGNISNLGTLAEFTKKHGLLLIVDATQSAGAIPIDVDQFGIDILCFTGHKGLLGPQGTGGIYVRDGISLRQGKVGGSGIHSFDRNHPSQMPEALEAGTLNVHGIAGLNAGVSFLLDIGIESVRAKEQSLTQRFSNQIKEIPGIKVYGDVDATARTGIVSINLGDVDSAYLADLLWEKYQICVRAGAHCAPLMHQTLGTAAQGVVRFSFSALNTETEADRAAQALKELSEELL